MDDRWTYLLINLASILLPFVFSFHPKIRFNKEWKFLFPGIAIALIVFILWDILYTHLGVWGFNDRYISGLKLVNLPIEEWMFFICIPYASLFIDQLMLGKNFPSRLYKILRLASKFIGLTLVILGLFNVGKLYTTSAFLLCSALLFYYSKKNVFKLSPNFLVSFLIILIPFFIVNGLLTGSWIESEIVWYNYEEFMGYRLGTIPIEDIFYGLALLLLIRLVMDKLKRAAISGNP